MGEKDIGSVLRNWRQKANYSVQDVSDILTKKGVRASAKTIYSWEKNRSQPGPDTLLMLCELYGIKDVMEAFGYKQPLPSDSVHPAETRVLSLSPLEAALLEAYRKADDDARFIVETALRRFFPPSAQPEAAAEAPGKAEAGAPAPIRQEDTVPVPAPENGGTSSSLLPIPMAARGKGRGLELRSREQIDAALRELDALAPDGEGL